MRDQLRRLVDLDLDAEHREPQREPLEVVVRAAVLARVGVAEESIAQIAAQLPDPVDLHEAAQLLQTYGLTRDARPDERVSFTHNQMIFAEVLPAQ